MRPAWAGWLGAGFAAAALALYFFSVHPAQLQLEQRQAQAGQRHLLRTGPSAADSAQSGLDAFHAYFPAGRLAPQQMQKVFAAAVSNDLQLAQAEYAYAQEPGARLASYRIELPVQGSDVRIRRFAVQVLNEVPTMALDEISFSREEAGSEVVDGKISFTLFLRAE